MGDLMDEAHKDATYIVQETTEGGSLLSHICKVGPHDVSNVEEVMIKKELSSVKAIYNQYCQVTTVGYFLSANKGRLSWSFMICSYIFSCPFNTSIKVAAKYIWIIIQWQWQRWLKTYSSDCWTCHVCSSVKFSAWEIFQLAELY